MLKVMSTKLPEELIASLDATAEKHGVTRNRLVREALEASVEGRVRQLTEDEKTRRRLQAMRERFNRDRSALRASLAADRDAA